MPNLGNLLSSPPSVLAQIPLAPAPPGVIPDFAHPASRAPEVLGVGFTFMGIATICFIIRLYTRICVLRKWQVEDTTLTLGFILAVIYYAAQVHGCLAGGFGKHLYELHISALIYPGWFFVLWCQNCLPLIPFGLIKVTILLQFWTLFSVKKWMRIGIYFGMAVIIPFYFLLTIAMIVIGSPWPGETQLQVLVSPRSNWIGNLIKPSGVIGVVVDVYLLILPLPAIAHLNMTRSKKVGIAAIFLTGIFACIASIIGCVARFRVSLDPLWDGAWSTLWVTVELWVGVVVACMPAIHQFWNRQGKLVWFSDKVKSSFSDIVQRSSGKANTRRSPKPAPPVKMERTSSDTIRPTGNESGQDSYWDMDTQKRLPIQIPSRAVEDSWNDLEAEKRLPIQKT